VSGATPTAGSLGVADARARVEGLTITVPGSSSNLGAGFDALAVAVRLYLRVTVRRVLDGPRNTLQCTFGGVALEGDNYVARSVTTTAAREGLDFPGLELEIASDIPMQAGLGSSAAATVAGLLLYDRLSASAPSALRRDTSAPAAPGAPNAPGAPTRDLLAHGTRFEGHPDNVAASLLGGLTVACASSDGSVLAVSNPWPDAVRLVAATPDVRVKTPEARRVLPETLSRADAIFNLQRAALLVAGLGAGRLDVLREALQDRWHQPFRAPLVPGLAEALRLEAPGLLGVCLSGSGPTIVALCQGETAPVERALDGVYTTLGLACRIRVLTAHNGPPTFTT
jgi:homoserine kinase